ncbi:unannotated protein [freshwater metagenome]|uniref:Unannotated protein n=1 Tax=freshwater metagenome TaxID=449393 RepID=A0A6J6JDK7_9ZZZZ|nr:ribonuclease D [Actinomycetota bacterium]
MHFITEVSQLDQVAEQLISSTGQIAIDAERASGYKYSQRAYLIQLRAKDSDIFLIDPVSDPGILTAKPYLELAAALKDREWILHAATQDLACLEEINLRPGAIFDTELAARLAGVPRVGLGALAESLLKVRLAKEHSAADWSTRPLPASWLNYAALDVDVLHELADAVKTLLDAQGKWQWAAEEFETLLSFKPKPQRPDRWRGIAGLNKVQDRLSLEIARQLWLAREELAQKIDVAAGRLIPDSSIFAAATEKPKTKPELASMKSFSGRASRSYLDHWWDAVQFANKASELPSLRAEKTDAIPNHRNWINKFPDADRRLKLAKFSLQQISEQLAVPLENLLSPDTLRQLSFSPPENLTEDGVAIKLMELGARPWQVNQTASAIAAAFSLAEKSPAASPAADPQESDEREEL